MQFRLVSAEALDAPGLLRRGDTSRRRNRDMVIAFIASWSRDDRGRMARSSTEALTCRWIGFGPEPVTAVGLDQVITDGRAFERIHGVAQRHMIVEALSGTRHVAVLFEPDGLGLDSDRVPRVAVYRIDAGRIATIAVYADRID